MEREVFVCPFCGAPDREVDTSDTPKTTCKYCGTQVILPRHLLGPTRRCTNHPEVLSVGQCAVCGQNFCEECLLAYTWGYAMKFRPVCPSCADKHAKIWRNKMKVYSVFSVAACLVTFFLTGRELGWGAVPLIGLFLFVLFGSVYTYIGMSKPPTTQTAEEWWRQRGRGRASPPESMGAGPCTGQRRI